MYKRILVPTDGSAHSTEAMRHALELARTLGSEVTFLYALEDPVTTTYTIPEAMPYQPELYDALKREAEAALQSALEEARAQGVRAKTALAEREDPVQAITEAQAEHDLVVMGTHGRRGFNRWMFGSVAEGVLRRATIPCLLIRAEPSKDD